MLWSPENPEVIQESKNNQYRAFEIVEEMKERSYDQIATFPVALLQDTAKNLHQQLLLQSPDIQEEGIEDKDSTVDTLKEKEVVPLTSLDVSLGQSQLVEIDNKQYEIGLSPRGQVFMRNNGTVYMINRVKADKSSFMFNVGALLRRGEDGKTAAVLKYEGYEIENVVRLRFANGQLYADYLRKGETQDPKTDKKVPKTWTYTDLEVPLEVLYSMKAAVDSQTDKFYVDEDTIRTAQKGAEKYIGKIGPDGEVILEKEDLEGIEHISRIKVDMSTKKSH